MKRITQIKEFKIPDIMLYVFFIYLHRSNHFKIYISFIRQRIADTKQ